MTSEADPFTHDLLELYGSEHARAVGEVALGYAADFVDPAHQGDAAVGHRFYAGVFAYHHASGRGWNAGELNDTEAELLGGGWQERRSDEPTPASQGHEPLRWLHLHRKVLADAEAATYGDDTWRLLHDA